MSQLATASESISADEAEFDLARQIQSTFVPARLQGWPGARVAVRRIASNGLGGDFHNVIRGFDNQYALVIGTVSGPGLYAALAKAVLSGAARKLAQLSRSPRILVDQLDRLLGHVNADLRGQSVSCSLFHGIVDCARGVLEYCNLGCHCPLIWRQNGELGHLKGTGSALVGTGRIECTCEAIELASLRRLVVFTEGLSKACSATGEPFGSVRGRRLVTDTLHLSVDEQVDASVRLLRDHTGPDCVLTYDVTLFVAEFLDSTVASVSDSMRTWLQTCEKVSGAAPDSSVFLG